MRIALALVLVAAVGCTGETAAVLVEHEGPDGEAEASADGPSPAADASQEHDAEGGADDAATPPRDAAGDEPTAEGAADAVDEDDAPDAWRDGADSDAKDAMPPDAGDAEASVSCPSSCSAATETDVFGQCDTGSSCLPPANSNITCLPPGMPVPYCSGTMGAYPCCIVAPTDCRFFTCPPLQ